MAILPSNDQHTKIIEMYTFSQTLVILIIHLKIPKEE